MHTGDRKQNCIVMVTQNNTETLTEQFVLTCYSQNHWNCLQIQLNFYIITCCLRNNSASKRKCSARSICKDCTAVAVCCSSGNFLRNISVFGFNCGSKKKLRATPHKICLTNQNIYVYTHTQTHTHIYIYTYIFPHTHILYVYKHIRT